MATQKDKAHKSEKITFTVNVDKSKLEEVRAYLYWDEDTLNGRVSKLMDGLIREVDKVRRHFNVADGAKLERKHFVEYLESKKSKLNIDDKQKLLAEIQAYQKS